MTTVTPSTPWRDTGDTTVEGLRAEFGRFPASPLIAVAGDLLAAAGGMARLMAAMSWVEQKHSTWPSVAQPTGANSHNFLSFSAGWSNGQRQWRTFASYAACVAFWRDRLLAADGPYAGTTTIRELLSVYAPASDGNNVDRYAAEVCEIINRMPLASSASSSTSSSASSSASRPASSTLTFHRVTPPVVEHHDIDPTLNTAWDDLGAREALFVVLHTTYGGGGWSGLMGTEDYFRGDARTRARTDYGLDNIGGRLVRWTDPLSRHSPYASGPYTQPSGDAPALVAKLGVLAVNRHGVSIEIAGRDTDPVSEAAFDSLAQLVAFWADYNEIPWDRWPTNPKTGVTFIYWHGEFNGEKRETCPNAAARAITTRLITRVGQILKTAQTSAVAPPVPVPTPARPERPDRPARPSALLLPPGVSLELVQGWFGQVTSNGDKALTFAFDASGPVTQAWLAYGAEEGRYPQLADVTVETDGDRWFRFEDGLVLVAAPGKAVTRLAS